MSVFFVCSNCNTGEPRILGVPQNFDSCARCHNARYCCKECQVAHWKAGHKDSCSLFSASLSVTNSQIAAIRMLFSFFNKPGIIETAHDLATHRMFISESRGFLVANFDSHLDAEKAILDGTLLSDFVCWWDPKGFIDLPETDAHNIASYDPSKEFVVMIVMGEKMCVSGIIDLEYTYFEESPFDLNLPYTKILIYDQTVTEDLTGEKGRRKLAVFTRNCVKAMGVAKTPSVIKTELDAFVDDGTKCHGIIKNGNGVAFAFAFGGGAQVFFNETVVPLFATEKKVVMVLPHGIDICRSFDVVEYSHKD